MADPEGYRVNKTEETAKLSDGKRLYFFAKKQLDVIYVSYTL